MTRDKHRSNNISKQVRAAHALTKILIAQGKEVFYFLLTHESGVAEVQKVYAQDAYQAQLYVAEVFEGYTIDLLGEKIDTTK